MIDEDFSLLAVSPLDGRYSKTTEVLAPYFSEFALNRYRLLIEVHYLLYFLNHILKRKISKKKRELYLSIVNRFDVEEGMKLKEIENVTKHDVKAIEYYLRSQLTHLELEGSEYIHFGLTSEDTNSLAYGLLFKEALQNEIVPLIQNLLESIEFVAKKSKRMVMLARTHGQVAVPTTMGKEMIVFAARIREELRSLKVSHIDAKLSGSVGNYNAFIAAYPRIDWIEFSDTFILSLGLKPNHYTTQIIQADSYVHIFQRLHLINSIIIGFNQDMWRYISDAFFLQKVDQKQVGSSTMPHKVNPIDFENSEGNLGLANSLLSFFSTKLPISRLQRDLTDSTIKRNIGVAFAYSLLGYRSCISGLSKVKVNETLLQEICNQHWEVVTEGMQTILRTTGKEDAYELIKKLSHGKQLKQKDILKEIDKLSVSKGVKKKLRMLTPETYIGNAVRLVDHYFKEDYEK